MRLPEDRKIPFSPRAKYALVGARKEMRRLGDGHFGAEHVLLGVLRNEDGAAVRMLGRLGVWSETLDNRLFELRGQAATEGWGTLHADEAALDVLYGAGSMTNLLEHRRGEVRGARLPRTPRQGSEQKGGQRPLGSHSPVSPPTLPLRLNPLGRLALGGAQ